MNLKTEQVQFQADQQYDQHNKDKLFQMMFCFVNFSYTYEIGRHLRKGT